MNFRTKVRTVRGGDIGLAAAILAVVLLGWLTASGSRGPGGDGTGNFYVAPRSPALLHH